MTGSSTSSSSTGTSGGSPPDAGACRETGSDLQTSQGYLPWGSAYGISNSADFNGDGLLDLVVSGADDVGDGDGFYVVLGLADGGLSPPTFYKSEDHLSPIVAADVNGDGLPDVLCIFWNGIDVLLNVAGELTAPQNLIINAPGIVAVAVGDLDQDGLPDVVGLQELGTSFYVDTFRQYLKGHFSPLIHAANLPEPEILASPTLFVSDLNHDGFPDIVAVVSGSSQLTVLIHQADGGYETSLYAFSAPITAAPVPRPGAAPDLVVWYNQDAGFPAVQGIVEVLFNAGDGTFSEGPSYPVPNIANVLANALAISDFNGDCLPDLAVSAGGGYQEGEGLSVLFGNLDGGFGPPQSIPFTLVVGQLATLGPSSNPRALAVSTDDISADGRPGDSLFVLGDASRH